MIATPFGGEGVPFFFICKLSTYTTLKGKKVADEKEILCKQVTTKETLCFL